MKKIIFILLLITNIHSMAQAITFNCFGYSNGNLFEAEIAGIEKLELKQRVLNPSLDYYKVWVRADKSPTRILMSDSHTIELRGFINPIEWSLNQTNTLFVLGDLESYLRMSFDGQMMLQLNRAMVKRLEFEKISNFETHIDMRCYDRL